MSQHRRVDPVLDVPAGTQIRPRGWIGERIALTEEHWLIPAPANNPGMVDMFHRPVDLKAPNGQFAGEDPRFGRNPGPLPWAGEFAGKWLIAAVQSIRMTGNPLLHEQVNQVSAGLIATQDQDGSLGLGLAWDVWNQYHVMLGLLRRYQQTGSVALLTAVSRAADQLVRRFGRPGEIARLSPGDVEMNQAVLHVLLLLYEETGVADYLNLATQIREEWKASGNYLENAHAGNDFFRGPRHRWESLHDVQAIAEFYLISGEDCYRAAFEQIWGNLVSLERHADGGFGGSEGTNGDRYSAQYVETCATVAWMALGVDMLRLSGDPAAADELELSLFNAMLGAQSADGRVWTYHTPLGGAPLSALPQDLPADPWAPEAFLGYRLPTTYDLDWQERDRYPQLSCCAANGARGLGCLSEWAVMRSADGVTVNFFGPSTATIEAPDGTWLTIEQDTDYPLGGHIELRLDLRVPSAFLLRLRIPAWSASASVRVNGNPQVCKPGEYCAVQRTWLPGDRIELDLDLAVRFVDGAGRTAGRVTVYRGPLLLTCDGRWGTDPLDPPAIHREQPTAVSLADPDTQVKATFRTTGAPMTLCDYASAWAFGAGRISGPPRTDVPWQFTRSAWLVDRSRTADFLSGRLLLNPDGSVGGYTNPNEARWGFEGDVLTFYAANGAASTRFTIRESRNGRQWLSGFSLFDPAVRHVLCEVDEGIAGKTWQFARRTDGGAEVILPQLGTLPGGHFDRRTHPNETRWGRVGSDLVFVAADGSVSTRFGSPRMVNGRVEYAGPFSGDPAITHVLTEIDPDVTWKVWRMWRHIDGLEDKGIDDKIRLLPGGRIDGHLHPNEAFWSRTGDDLLFHNVQGLVTTKFTALPCRDGVQWWRGQFALNASITHMLEERAIGWPLTPGYVSWLTQAPGAGRHGELRRPPDIEPGGGRLRRPPIL